jgi:hypothetical protein
LSALGIVWLFNLSLSDRRVVECPSG